MFHDKRPVHSGPRSCMLGLGRRGRPRAIDICAGMGAKRCRSRYPARPITLVVPQTAGGLVDTFTRSMARQLSSRLGQPVVVENRTGASQAIGAEAVAQSAPDGYTFFVGAQSAMVLNVVSRKSVPYDPIRDFDPVTLMFRTPFYLVVNNSLPAKSIQELVAFAKSKPGELTYASTGPWQRASFRRRDVQGAHWHQYPARALQGQLAGHDRLESGQVDMMFEGGARRCRR